MESITKINLWTIDDSHLVDPIYLRAGTKLKAILNSNDCRYYIHCDFACTAQINLIWSGDNWRRHLNKISHFNETNKWILGHVRYTHPRAEWLLVGRIFWREDLRSPTENMCAVSIRCLAERIEIIQLADEIIISIFTRRSTIYDCLNAHKVNFGAPIRPECYNSSACRWLLPFECENNNSSSKCEFDWRLWWDQIQHQHQFI